MNKDPSLLVSDHEESANPTVQQQRASDPALSVWVNASAGSGKTTVLTNRVVRLLLDGVSPERILCLTYTRAAAAEMAIRITKYLSHWATCSDEALRLDFDQLQGKAPSPEQFTRARRLFARVLNCPGGMRIRTIHAFCQEILQRFPIEAGVPPHFSVIEEADAEELQKRVLRELLREADHHPEDKMAKALKFLVLEQGEDTFIKSMRMILGERARLKAALAKAGGLDDLIAGLRQTLDLKPGITSQSMIAEATSPGLLPEADLRQMAKALLTCASTYRKRGETILAWLDSPAAERTRTFSDYIRCFLKKEGGVLTQMPKKEKLIEYPDLKPVFDREAARLDVLSDRLETLGIAETTAAILIFGQALIQRYENHKAVQAVMDFDDLIQRADHLLQSEDIAPWVLYKLDGGIEHILVDEAQDTSGAQWNIVRILADEFFAGVSARSDINRTLFVVGDEKQSIFSFQRADPEAFADMRRYFAQRIRGAGKLYKEVPLSVSFRSSPAILRAVDQVFADENVRAGVSETPVQHRAFEDRKTFKLGRVEVWKLQPKTEKDKDPDMEDWELPLEYEAERDPQVELAQQIASRIKLMISGEGHGGRQRHVNAGDIMILLRRRGRFADIMVRALKEQNVPVTGVDRMDLVKQLAVMDLLALIQFVLLPEDDLTLATVLRGPLLNMSEDDLMDLAMERSATLWQQLSELSAHHPLYAKAHDFLSRWLNRADFLTPFAMLSDLLNEPCPASKVSGRQALWTRLGADALDPIEELLNAAQTFSHRHTPSLQHFLHWLMATEAEIKREQDRGSGQVRIMTVHASKGLEAPIVFLPDTSAVPKVTDLPRLQWGKEEDGGEVPLYLARKPAQGVARQYWDHARQKQLEEYRRLLYVALTRAATELYVCGWEPTRTESSSEESWYNLVRNALASLHDTELALPANPETEIVFADHKDVHQPEPRREERPSFAPCLPLPDWVMTQPAAEPAGLHYLVPSQMVQGPATATPDSTFARGKIIHRLLQSLPMVEDDLRDEVVARFLGNPQHSLSVEQQSRIGKEVLTLLRNPDYAPIFAPTSRAEVPLIGRVQGMLISGQIDRLCLHEDALWIVDYKTNRPPPEQVEDVPLAYLKQLASYRVLLQQLYPLKTLRCFLLWTYKPLLMEIPESLMPQLLLPS